MSKPFLALAEAAHSAPDDELPGYHDDRPEIQRLFELALEAGLPRKRDLKSWEPQRLNERHLTMVQMRAGGLRQRQIAQIMGVTDSNASIVLNHPDAEYLLSRLQSMRATQPTEFEERMFALSEPALNSLENVFTVDDPDELKVELKRAPLAFKVLEMNGHVKKKPTEVEHNHKHQLEASPKQMDALKRALEESREVRSNEILVLEEPEEARLALSPGGEPPDTPPCELSTKIDTDAPSIGDSQERAEPLGGAEGRNLAEESEDA